MKTWGKIGACWERIWESILGSAYFLIPGIGSLIIAGPIVEWLTGAPRGAVILGDICGFADGLVNIGIPENSIVKCEKALQTDKFIVMAHGTSGEVEQARNIIATSSPMYLANHPPTNDSDYLAADEIWWNDYL
jgi:hypothetical protein